MTSYRPGNLNTLPDRTGNNLAQIILEYLSSAQDKNELLGLHFFSEYKIHFCLLYIYVCTLFFVRGAMTNSEAEYFLREFHIISTDRSQFRSRP